MMIELTGISLSERHKQLNAKISDATKNIPNFDEIKYQVEKSDVDKLYKIGVASKCKNVEYIIESLKSGDSLCISKALKCIWLYSNEYSHIINPEYLHENIFPVMSIKMTKKFLLTISMYVRDKRTADFYKYCKKMKHTSIAIKFLIFTPDSFKLDVLKEDNILDKLRRSDELLINFLGNSFDLAEAYYKTVSEYDKLNTLYKLRHFYTISDVKYLELISKSNGDWKQFKRMGLRISKDIMKKHKDEIYKNPTIYLYVLNKSMLVQYSTEDDAKLYAKTIISYEYPKVTDFWNKNLGYNHFYDKYAYILDKIPLDQRLQFIKNIYTEQYPGEEFEMSKEFYNAKLYRLMTPEEREKWALSHVQRDLEFFGTGRDFLWYRFVSFNKAFVEIQRYIRIAVNIDVRIEVILVLVESAKTDRDLEILFDYYYKRHINEQGRYKERFVDAIISEHNIYNFGESCWNAFNKILFSLDVYNILDCVSKSNYKYIALIYHIIHGKEVPEALTKCIDSGIYMYAFKTETDKLTKENEIIVYQYLLQFYFDKISSFDHKLYDDEVKFGIRKYIHFVLDLMFQYKKLKEDIPEIVNKYIQLDFDEFRNHLLLRLNKEKELTHELLMRYLKKDKELVISNLPLISNDIKNLYSSVKLTTFLKKIRTYFLNDLALIFLKLFEEILAQENVNSKSVKMAIHGIFELADMDFKIDFMTKYVPEEAKIDHSKVDRKILYIQEAICNMLCYSRPPVPLPHVTKYIKGDFVKFCLPMFYSYLAKLPKPVCLEFVKSLLDRPISVQKHGLRMAFECFNIEDLRRVILDVWSYTVNVSLRSIIFTYVYNKIRDLDENDQDQLFEDLKSFTSSLTQEDDVEIFTLITSDSLPRRFIGDLIEIAWPVVDSFPSNKEMYIERRRNVIDYMNRNIHLLKKDAVEPIVYDHIDLMLKQEQIKHCYENPAVGHLVQSKWKLLHKYVTFFVDEDNFHRVADLVMDVIKESIRIWDKVDNNKYVVKEFVSDFVTYFNCCSYEHEFGNYAKINIIFERILKELQDNLPPKEMYDVFWSIRVSVITRNVIADGKKHLEHDMNRNVTALECLNTFVKEFSNLFITSIKDRHCFVSLFDVINDKLYTNLRYISMYLNDSESDIETKINNALVLICLDMLEYKYLETYMFAAKLLPCDIDSCTDKENYLKIIHKLKSCEFNEVQFYMYRKFVNADYIYRNFILPLRQEII